MSKACKTTNHQRQKTLNMYKTYLEEKTLLDANDLT